MSGLDPVSALRVIRRVAEDKQIRPPQRVAIITVILNADNKTALSWTTYRAIQGTTGVAPATVAKALRYAKDRYLRKAAVGGKGAVQYRVLPALHSLKRSSASQGEAPALQPVKSSASQGEAILTPLSHPTTNPKGARRRAAALADARVKAFIRFFCETYEATLGRAYVIIEEKDSRTIKALLGRLDGNAVCALAELKAAARTMLADSWGGERADIGLLSSQINRWRRGASARSGGRPSTFTPASASTNYSGYARDFGQGGAT